MREGPPLSPVIGLEVHAQLATKSKMFCGCDARYVDSTPNTHVCPVCLGLPGSLPVINRVAVEYTVMTALALRCELPESSKFDRKNYSYPDLPKGFQTSQYDQPVGVHGNLIYRIAGKAIECGIIRVHLEEDTGKTIHTVVDGREVSLVDYNRSGVPLMEIVSEPDIDSPEAAREYFVALRQVLVYLRVNDGNLQEGSLRADVNVSVRAKDGRPGTKVEIKNLNSFRAVQRSLEYEIERLREIVIANEVVLQETRGWSEDEGRTTGQRSKEYASDYRYFPEPDLPSLRITSAWLDEIRSQVPELPDDRRRRFIDDYRIREDAAGVLTLSRHMAEFFESVVASEEHPPPQLAARWLCGDVSRLLNDDGIEIEKSRLTPALVARLLGMIEIGTISGAAGKQVLDAMYATGDDPRLIVERDNLAQIGDAAELESIVDAVLASNQPLVETYRSGKTNAIQALVGQVMKASKGKANPAVARELLEQKLQ